MRTVTWTASRGNRAKREFGLLEPAKLTPKDVRGACKRCGDVKSEKRQL